MDMNDGYLEKIELYTVVDNKRLGMIEEMLVFKLSTKVLNMHKRKVSFLFNLFAFGKQQFACMLIVV